MKITYLFLLLFVYNSHFSCIAQNTLQSDLKTYKENIKGKIIRLIKNERQLNGTNPDNISIEAIPYCVFKPELKENGDLSRFSIFIDTSSRMVNELILWSHILFSIPEPRRTGDSFFTDIEYPDSYSIKGIPDIPMIQTAQRHSGVYFYLKLLDRDAAGNVPMAFMDHESIHLIDRNLNVYSGIKEFIETKYGCVDKYLEMLKDDEDRRKSGRNLSASDAKAILRNDFELWWRHFPADTPVILNLFLNQMDSIVKMQSGQRILLDSKIKRDIGIYPTCTCSNGIVLFGRDVSSLILSVLTYDQYIIYIQRRNDLIWLRGLAVDRLNTYYIIERKIPIEKEDEILNNEVFSPR